MTEESLSPTERPDRGRTVALAAMGALVATGVALIVKTPRRVELPPEAVEAAISITSTRVASTQGPQVTQGAQDAMIGGGAAPAVKAAEPSIAPSGGPEQMKPRPPPAWRVATLKGDPGIDVVDGSFGKRTLAAVLGSVGLGKSEVKRLTSAFHGLKRIEHPGEKDTFVLAKDRAKGALVAFEYATSPLDIWQAKADAEGRLEAKKLDIFVEQKRVASALVVSADLEKAVEKAGLRKELIEEVGDALEGHVDAGTIRAGVRMRVAAVEDWVEGVFNRVRVQAIELVPKSGSPLRVYYYERGSDVEGSKRRAPPPGFYDAKGHQPYRGAFRSPVPLARVTSRFNPKRMHPVLKVVMPHNGVDFGGSTGTPVFASAAGTVIVAGNGGPCGNMVEIEHGGGLTTAYCHLSKFAAGLHAGQKVDGRQLVGYVGQTGRVTGPHLHFAVKRNGAFIDPLALKLDGVRVLPAADRDAFARRRAELDSIIDGIALPSAADIPDEPEDKEDKDLHGAAE